MNDVTIEECKFSGDMVPYMYGELPTAEGSAFESHLIDCARCTDEFASISHARYEIYDWKKLEFDRLETPLVEIPYDEVTTGQVPSVWVEKLRAAFSQRWSVPGVAFAGLAVVLVFAAIFILSRDKGLEIATEFDNTNSPVISDPPRNTSGVTTVVAGRETENKTAAEPEPKPSRISAPTRHEQKRSVRHVKVTQPRSVEARQASTLVEPAVVPRLNEFSDDEDTSLRLAELFDDIETRD